MENKENNNKNKNNSFFLIICIIIIVICITATGILSFLKIIKMKNEILNNDGKTNSNDDKINHLDENSKYICTSFEEKYDINSLKVTSVYEELKNPNISLSYFQISGLKNKSIENAINNEVKDTVMSLTGGNLSDTNHIIATVTGNFSDILSISIHKYIIKKLPDYNTKIEESIYKTLNYSLKTGEKIKFEDLFSSKAPINLMISNATYKSLALEAEMGNQDSLNMDLRDTSMYDDKLLMAVNKYKKNKGNTQFTISPTQILVYGLKENDGYISINIKDYIEYITIFKKYVSYESLYEANTALKGIFICTVPVASLFSNNMYGKISDNLYIDVGMTENSDNARTKKIEDDLRSRINDKVNELNRNALTNKDKGYTYQAMLNSTIEKEFKTNNGVNYYWANITQCYTEMPIDYYNANLLNLLTERAAAPKASIDGLFLYDYYINHDKEIIKCNKITENFYYDMNGNYIGDSIEAVEGKQTNNFIGNS